MHEGTNNAQSRAQIFIKRPRLTKLLDEAGGRILLLLAPAGYGKTTLAREWTAGKDRVGWYAGGHSMADVAALSVGIAETLGAMGDPPRNDMVERVRILAARGHDPRGLAKAVSSGAPGADWLLVVDDYHYADGSADAEAFFEELVALTDFRLLIATRERPAWLAARRVVYGEATIVEMDALAFTHEEARAVLEGEGTDELLTEARGWPAVIGLAALRRGTEVATGLNPDDLYRFFAEDLFQRTPARLRKAMFRLALAGDASVERVRELLGGSHKKLLDEAAERGFLSPAGRQVVHPLLRGFLLAKLAELDAPEVRRLVEQIVDFLAKDARWDDCLFALEHFPDDELILLTLGKGLAEILDSGRIATVSRWLALAAREEINEPLLLLAEAEVALRGREEEKAHALGEQAGTQLKGDLAARAYVVAARGAHLRDANEEAFRLAREARRMSVSRAVRVDALWTAFNAVAEHQTVETTHILGELRRFKALPPVHTLRLKSANAMLLSNAGAVRKGLAEAEQAKALLPKVDDPFARTNLLHWIAYLNLLAGEYEESLVGEARLAEEATRVGLQFVIDHGLLRRAGALIGLRRLGEAQRAISELQRRSPSASDFVLDNMNLQNVRLAITTGDQERATALLRMRLHARRPAFQGEVRCYQALLAVSRGDVDSARDHLAVGQNYRQFVESAALGDVAQAILDFELGTPADNSLRNLHRLVASGDADAVVFGCRVWPPLVEHCAVSEPLREALVHLLARSHDSDIARSAGLTIPRELRPRERLSSRELEVYDLMVQGRSNQDIAKTLFITESTTKVHVRHIFEKLGVRTRVEAARLSSIYDRSD